MGWTAPRTWVASEVVTAAIMNTHVRDNLTALNGYVAKTADQSVTSSAVLANDSELFYSIGGAGTYVFDLHLYGVSAANAAGDIQFSISFPAGTCYWGDHVLDPALPSSVIASLAAVGFSPATSGTSVVSAGLSTTITSAWLHGLLIATAAGTLRLMWSQQASNANASTLKAGSHMSVRQVA